MVSLVKRSYEFEEFYALKDLTFHVPPGEFLGIIGRNGSGKSTLLKILSKIYLPSEGRVDIRDEVYPLLELGVGFQPDFTVLDNIYLYGSLLGFSRHEMKRRIVEILEFSELTRFADSRLENLSTGMQVRLGFAIAIQSLAPIVLVDEVLAVGDLLFAEKCRNAFWKFKREGRTIILVTHDLSAVREFCSRVLVMDQGQIVAEGDAAEMVSVYEQKILQLV